MTEKNTNPKAAREHTENRYDWKCVELPNYHEPTEEERELIRVIGHSCMELECYTTVLALMTHEWERDRESLNVAWLGTLIYEAGKIHGIQQERRRRKERYNDKRMMQL